MKELPTVEFLESIFDYCLLTGVIKWKIRTHGALIGNEAGYICKEGYRVIGINRTQYLAHRLLWKLHTGKDPSYEIDHINRCREDNRIENLRVVTQSENLKNKTKYINNTSGYSGVVFNKKEQRWQARINVDKKSIHLGTFKEKSEAIDARKQGEKKYGFSPIGDNHE